MTTTIRQSREVAYLVNQYPAPSHTFIRREIAALENIGWKIHRFSHRRSRQKLVNKRDKTEAAETTVLLSRGVVGLLLAMAKIALQYPVRSWQAFILSLRMAYEGNREFAKHIAYFGLACQLTKYMQRLGHPHLHAHFSTNSATVARLYHCISSKPYSLTIHASFEYEEPNHLNLKEKIAHANTVVMISRHGYDAVTTNYPEFKSKIKLVRCGLNGDWFQRTVTPMPNSIQFLCIARIVEQKNPGLLIRAAALLRDRGADFRLVLAGDGQLRPSIEQLIVELNLSKYVKLVGWCDDVQVRQLIDESIATVLSSVAEGIPTVVMESFACGRPVIATDAGAVSELVETGSTGWLTPLDDPIALMNAMKQCLEMELTELQQMATAARNKIKDYDVRSTATSLSEIFEQSI